MNEPEDAFQAPQTEKQVVIYRQGWGFHLPEQHRAMVWEGGRLVSLSTPDRGGQYHLERIEETDDEYRIHVGDWTGTGHGLGDLEARYPFPTIDVELDRLRNEWLQLGGDRQQFEAWAQGDSWDSKTTRARAELRAMRAASA